MLNYSKSDVNRNRVVDAKEWLPAEVIAYTQKESKAGDSINHIVDFRILNGPYEGMEVRNFFSEKFVAGVFPFWIACGGSIEADGGSVDLEATIGKQIQICVAPRTGDDGRTFNNILDFRPLDA
jgi:hypothetical protein